MLHSHPNYAEEQELWDTLKEDTALNLYPSVPHSQRQLAAQAASVVLRYHQPQTTKKHAGSEQNSWEGGPNYSSAFLILEHRKLGYINAQSQES
eukprot:2663686-Amphidinium_carterae.1